MFLNCYIVVDLSFSCINVVEIDPVSTLFSPAAMFTRRVVICNTLPRDVSMIDKAMNGSDSEMRPLSSFALLSHDKAIRHSRVFDNS